MTVHEIITEKIIKSLEGGIIPWRKPWTTMMPVNFVSRKPYRGINPFLLSLEPRKSRYWLSYKQMLALGGHLKDNDKKATVVIYWRMLDNTKAKPDDKNKTIPMLRYYNVFNLDQVEGIEVPNEATLEFTPIEQADKVIADYPKAPPIKHEGDRACYSPPLDTIYMPLKETFLSVENYYATLFHEMIHSTGHKSRLNRGEAMELVGFGSETYSKEELVAEIGSSFLCAETGIVRTDLEENTTAYIQSWLQVLKGDKKFVVLASAKAQKAVDWILDRKFEKCEDCGGSMSTFKDGSGKTYCPKCWGDITPTHD